MMALPNKDRLQALLGGETRFQRKNFQLDH